MACLKLAAKSLLKEDNQWCISIKIVNEWSMEECRSGPPPQRKLPVSNRNTEAL